MPKQATIIQFSFILLIVLAGLIESANAYQGSPVNQTSKLSFEETESQIAVKIGDELFTNFVRTGYDKPFCYPIYGPGQIGMTRNWPMKADVSGEAHDHPHHKSMWFAHEINGVDFWSEADGKIQVVEVELLPTDDGFRADSSWIRKNDNVVICSDSTVYRFGFDETARWIDATITLNATHGDVTWEDTKEGTFAMRTHPDLRLTPSPQDGVTEVFGTAINSEGIEGKAIWGHAAKWVLYAGSISGTPMAIAMFDHPENLRHPTTWHARDYGLVAANPFGLHDFLGKPAGSGEYTIKNGDSLTLRYRALFINGERDIADIEQRYTSFANH